MELGVDLEGTRNQYLNTKAQEQHAEEGDSVDLVLQLPDGRESIQAFKLGHTVAYVKLVVEKEAGIPMDKQRLVLNGKDLLDPLSLADCAGIAPGTNCMVKVLEVAQ
jgi:hypothetical protein